MAKTLKRLIITGGAQRQRAIWYDEFHHYRLAKVAEVDLQSGQIIPLLDYETPAEYCPADRPSIVFKCASFKDDHLYLCTQTEVLVVSYPDMVIRQHISHPCFNDLHHVLPADGRLYVVNTGLDSLVVLDAKSGEILGHHSVCGDKIWSRFDAQTDYRKVPSTKPHTSHPNFAFELEGRIWVTRCLDKDARCIVGEGGVRHIGVERIHDGNLHGDALYFTTVNGHICVQSPQEDRLLADHDLLAYSQSTDPLGWCRGLHIEGETAWVGFSRIRATRMHNNMRWMKNFGKIKHHRPTRISAFDLGSKRLLREIDLEDAGFSAVFSILPVYGES